MAKPSNIFPSLISGAGPLDNREVLTVIRGVCGYAVQETPGEILCSPNQPTDGYALRLKFSKTDEISAVEPGPLCTPTLVSTIRENIEANLVQSGPTVVCTKVLFASNELRGRYRYRDRCQILPMPEAAPRPSVAPADYPFRVEFKVTSSADPLVTSLRAIREARRWELLLSGIVSNRIHQIDTRAHWVLTESGACIHALAQYVPMGFPQNPDFTDSNSVPAADQEHPDVLFGPLHHAHHLQLQIPSNCGEILDAFFAAPTDRQDQFLRACFWLQQADLAFTNGFSPSFIHLVIAVENLLDKSSEQCDTCSQPKYSLRRKFAEFLQRYVSPEIVAYATLGAQRPFLDRVKTLYDQRSSIAHGAVLTGYDTNYAFAPRQNTEARDIATLSGCLPAALGQWMMAPTIPAPEPARVGPGLWARIRQAVRLIVGDSTAAG